MKEAEEDVPTINTVWHRIEAHAGQVFRQMRGADFTYRIDHSVVCHPLGPAHQTCV